MVLPGLESPVQRGSGNLESPANFPHRVKVVVNPQSDGQLSTRNECRYTQHLLPPDPLRNRSSQLSRRQLPGCRRQLPGR